MRQNLFDTRGGVAMIGRCEECNDEISDDSASGLCAKCEAHYVIIDEEVGDGE